MDVIHATYCEKGKFVDDIDQFDNAFQYFRRRSMLMDPRQRPLLEATCTALEQTEYGDAKRSGLLTGVFIGSSYNYYDREIPLAGFLGAFMGILLHNKKQIQTATAGIRSRR